MKMLQKISHPDSKVATVNDFNDVKKVFLEKEYTILIIYSIASTDLIKSIIKYCKRDYPALPLFLIIDLEDILNLEEYYSLGIDICLPETVKTYEFKIALEKAFNSEKYISMEISGKLAKQFLSPPGTDLLDTTEIEFLKLLAEDNSIEKIANKMQLSTQTVSTIRKGILLKLRYSSTRQLLLFAKKNNL